MIKKEEIVYRCKLSSEFSSSDKDSFIELFNRVFNLNYTRDWFDWKYVKNIYGDSYIVMAYHKDKAVGIRAFWRNDIDGIKCFQPCDTAVLAEYRGLGIFTKMSLLALENTKGAFIYNFPNENSRPGNLKLGWKIDKHFYLQPVINKKKLRDECGYIKDDYLNWRFIQSPIGDYSYYEIDGESYLLYKRTEKIYYVLGRFNSSFNNKFTKADFPLLFKYSANKGFINNFVKNKATALSLNNEVKLSQRVDIPIFKADYF